MSSSETSLDFSDAVLGAVLDALQPLVAVAESPLVLYDLMDDLGWVVPQTDVTPGELGGLTSLVGGIDDVRLALEAYRAAGNVDAASVTGLVDGVVNLVRGLAQLGDQPTVGLPEPLSLPEFWSAMAEELPGYLLAGYLRRRSPLMHAVLRLFGILDRTPPSASTWRIERRSVDVIRWNRLGTLLSDPKALIADVYGWGGTLQHEVLLRRIRDSLTPLGVAAFLRAPDQELLDRHYGPGTLAPDDFAALRTQLFVDELGEVPVELGVEVFPVPQAPGSPSPVGLFLSPYGSVALTTGVNLTENVTLAFHGTARSDGTIGVVLRPDGAEPILDGATPSGALGLRVAYTPPEPKALIGNPDGTSVSVAGAALLLELILDGVAAEAVARLDLSGLTVRIDFGGADGFLATVTGGAKGEIVLDGAILWSSESGLLLDGGIGLTLTIPVHMDLGPLLVTSVTIALSGSTKGSVVSAAMTASLTVGPFAGVVDGVGIRLLLEPSDDGPVFGLAPRFGFKPPSGVGLAIDVPAVRGGGYLSLDEEAGRYEGLFELTIIDLVSVTAIALVTTRPRVALLIVITAEGFTPIPLGFGFSLTGIGGLLALNRTVDVDTVRGGLRSGVIDSVLFVRDPVRNAPRILDTLDCIFPSAPDRLVIGPLAEISWGSPPLVKVRLALLLEVPEPIRVILLASLSVALPNESEAVVALHMDAIGVLDLGRGELTLDASLHDSRLLSLTLAGDMALRLNWGDDPGFTLSIGGFHPRYRQIARGRPMERVSLSLTGRKNPSVRLEAYIAITSNSIQVGARASVYAELLGFGIDGGGGFDALVQWSPFAFDVSAEVWVRVFTPIGTLLGIRLALQVSGPAPWHIAGTAELTIFFFTFTVGIDFTSGESAAPPLPESVDLVKALWDAVKDVDAWAVSLPAGVAAAAPPDPHDANGDPVLLVNPLATLTLSQRVVPLGEVVTRVGARVPSAGPRTYDLDVEVAAGVRAVPHTDLFARAQFEDIPDDEKLSRPAFEPLKAGYDLLPEQAVSFVTDDIATTTVTADTRTLGCDAQPAANVPAGVVVPLTWSPGWTPPPGGLAPLLAQEMVVG